MLGFDVHRRVAARVWDDGLLRTAIVAGLAGIAAWLVETGIDPHDRISSLVTVVAGGAVGLGFFFAAGRLARLPLLTGRAA